MEELGYIRVGNLRGDEDFCAQPDEIVIVMDRTNPLFGNPHHMKTKNFSERERVIELYKQDLELDVLNKGERWLAMQKIAQNIAFNNAKVCILCW